MRYKGVIATKDSIYVLYNGNTGAKIYFDKPHIKHKLISSFSGHGIQGSPINHRGEYWFSTWDDTTLYCLNTISNNVRAYYNAFNTKPF